MRWSPARRAGCCSPQAPARCCRALFIAEPVHVRVSLHYGQLRILAGTALLESAGGHNARRDAAPARCAGATQGVYVFMRPPSLPFLLGGSRAECSLNSGTINTVAFVCETEVLSPCSPFLYTSPTYLPYPYPIYLPFHLSLSPISPHSGQGPLRWVRCVRDAVAATAATRAKDCHGARMCVVPQR